MTARDEITRRVMHLDGLKVIKDVDLAGLFGLTPNELYRRFAPALWLFSRTSMLSLSRDERGRRARGFQPALAFTRSGVLLSASLLLDERALRTAWDIARVLKQKRRNTATKKRALRRSSDPAKTAGYRPAVERMQAKVPMAIHSQPTYTGVV